jgi:tRNA nucleotidyltransferase/poly(A) polymerase
VLRAVRFGAELGFAIELGTMDAVVKFAQRLEHIAGERIRDEFIKIIMSEHPMEGIVLLNRTGVLR